MMRNLVKPLILSTALFSSLAYASETYFGPQKIGGYETCEVQLRTIDAEKAQAIVIFRSHDNTAASEVIDLVRSPWDEPGDYMREVVKSLSPDGSAAVTDIQFIRLSQDPSIRARDGIEYYNRRFTTSYPGRVILIRDLEACPNLKLKPESAEPQAKPGVVEDADSTPVK